MRIAIGGIATENSTFSVWTTQKSDFSVTRGDALLQQYPFLGSFTDFTFIPIMRARALPGGPVDATAYAEFKADFIKGLNEDGPWDGVYLDMHGAMNVRGMDDAEGDWMAATRTAVGDSCIICASYDLHGNFSERVFENLDLATAYRTAPHIDTLETRERAVYILCESLRSGTKPAKYRVFVPIALPGEKTSTEWDPGMSLYARLPETLQRDGILDASILVGYAWADEPRAGAVTLAYGSDASVVRDEARRLASAFWDVRRQFEFGVPTGSSDGCIDMALQAPESCVFISDSGDNPTAGGVGDVTYTLGRMIARGVPASIYASIPDSAAVEACHQAGEGSTIRLSLGGKLDTRYGEALEVEGKVLTLKSFPRHEYGRTLQEQTNKQAVLQVGEVRIIITEHRTPFHYIAQFEQLDLDPLAHKMVVIKIGYLEPDLKRTAPKALLALSPGAVNQALDQLPYQRISRPIFPLDPDMEWQPT